MRLSLDDSRRLTGPNLLLDHPGAIIDVLIDGVPGRQVIDCWQRQIRSYLDAVGWQKQIVAVRRYAGGASLAISAPLDALYAATEVNESAWHDCVAEMSGGRPHPFAARIAELKQMIDEESNPRLLEMVEAAEARGLLWLADDDHASIGSGAGCSQWPIDAIPPVESLRLDTISDVPRALITGTNGKSTSVRLAAGIAAAAGRCAGITSTDYIRIGETIIDEGDYSGPGGARTLLRDERCEMALLEVARGGILRRGLAVTTAQAALVTNVAADHLGDYGILTVEDLIHAKLVVRKALAPTAPLILNADDDGLVAYARQHLPDQRIVWFSSDHQHPVLRAHQDQGGETTCLIDGQIVRSRAIDQTPLMPIAEAPITLGGAAVHNVQNVLGVVALMHALGLSDEAICQGLQQFRGDHASNPGRGNLYERDDIRILVDFAHNEHGMQAVAQTVSAMPASRRLVLMGQAGDRSDEAIDDLVRAALGARPDLLIACDLPGYERGRAPGDIPALIRRQAIGHGQSPEAIQLAKRPSDGVRQALAWAQPGDLLLLFVLNDRQESVALIDEFIRTGDRPT